MVDFAKYVSTKSIPQSEPIPGKSMAKNHAGGYTFEIDCWKSLNRFLILSSENGSYYASEKELTQENATKVIECIKEDGFRALQLILDVSVSGKAPKNDAAIFALALVTTYGNQKVKNAAYDVITEVCRTGTHIFQFCQAIQSLRGWSRGLRKGVARFYTDKTPEQITYQLIKYQQRNGWTHRDVMRLCHPKATTDKMNWLFKYAVKKAEADCFYELGPFESLKATKYPQIAENLIRQFRLPREAVPTELLNDVKVWDALLENMPITAMIRNLGKMSSVGLLASNLDESVKKVANTLTDLDVLKKGRVHPLHLLLALKTYEQGHGMKGSLSWNPVPKVVDALNDAFYLSFDTIVPTGLNYLYGLDVSGSMGSQISGYPISSREVAAALAMVLARTEPNHVIMAFDHSFVNFPVSPRERLDAVVRRMEMMNFSDTDCSMPMIYATMQNLAINTFAVITDNETWAGAIHPVQALQKYRQKSGLPAKLAVLATAANQFSIADPNDSGMIDLVGISPDMPSVLSMFSRGEV